LYICVEKIILHFKKILDKLFRRKIFSDLHKIFVSFQSLAALLFLLDHDPEGFAPGVRPFRRLSEGQGVFGEDSDGYHWPVG